MQSTDSSGSRGDGTPVAFWASQRWINVSRLVRRRQKPTRLSPDQLHAGASSSVREVKQIGKLSDAVPYPRDQSLISQPGFVRTLRRLAATSDGIGHPPMVLTHMDRQLGDVPFRTGRNVCVEVTSDSICEECAVLPQVSDVIKHRIKRTSDARGSPCNRSSS